MRFVRPYRLEAIYIKPLLRAYRTTGSSK